jgi:hypothetical protein
MRARAAYISSFGTGGIIVASAFLMLALVSALVAFHGWPGGDATAGPVNSVPFSPSAANPLRQVRTADAGTATVKASAGKLSRTAATRDASSAGLVKTNTLQVGGRVPGVVKVAPPTSGPSVPPVQQPPPSTGPQPTGSSGSQQTHRRQPQPRGDDPLIEVPRLPPTPLPGDVQDTAGGVVDTLPPPPDTSAAPVEQVTLPGDVLGTALGAVSVTIPSP